jgi:hypothetical protein
VSPTFRESTTSGQRKIACFCHLIIHSGGRTRKKEIKKLPHSETSLEPRMEREQRVDNERVATIDEWRQSGLVGTVLSGKVRSYQSGYRVYQGRDYQSWSYLGGYRSYPVR